MSEQLLHEVNRLLDQVGDQRVMRELSVHRTTLLRWRRGTVTIPAAQLRAIRALAYDVGTEPEWEGWRLRDGKLWSPAGIPFKPGDLDALPYVYGELDALRAEVVTLRQQVAALSVDPHVRGESANDAATVTQSQLRAV